MESHGLILFRNNKKLEFLMIKKKCSYSLYFIINGFYKKNKKKLIKLLSNTTFLEKSLLLMCDYDFLYTYATNRKKENFSLKQFKIYENCKIYFNKVFTKQFLEEVIFGLKSIDLIWEFPKGKINTESSLDCAKREFYEETGINVDNKNLLPIPPIIYDFNDNNKNYRYTLYVADGNNLNINNYKKHFYYEVSDIKWINLKNYSSHLDENMKKLYINVYKKLKFYLKKNKCLGF